MGGFRWNGVNLKFWALPNCSEAISLKCLFEVYAGSICLIYLLAPGKTMQSGYHSLSIVGVSLPRVCLLLLLVTNSLELMVFTINIGCWISKLYLLRKPTSIFLYPHSNGTHVWKPWLVQCAYFVKSDLKVGCSSTLLRPGAFVYTLKCVLGDTWYSGKIV